MPSTAMVAISRCEELVLYYDFSIVYAGRRQACIESVLVTLAVQNVDVEKLCHVLSLACRVVARSVAVARLNMSAFAKATA